MNVNPPESFTHFSEEGQSRMVDIAGKEVTSRYARARGFVSMKPETVDLIRKRLLPKGDLFELARIAGIMAAKKNAELIPLCHPLELTFVDVAVAIDDDRQGIAISSEVRLKGRTGAEMEALTAVSVASLTVYDMCKAVDRDMVITDICLVEKRGGKSDYTKTGAG